MHASALLRRAGSLAVGAVLATGLVAWPALAVGSTPSTTTINLADLNPKPEGRTTDIMADVAPQDATGTVTFYDVTGGGMVELASAPLGSGPVQGVQRATWTVPADFATGTYLVMAEYNGDDTYAVSDSDTFSFTVGPRPTATQVTVTGPHDASGQTAQKGDTLTVGATVADLGLHTPNQIPVTGTVTVEVDGSAVGTFAAPSGSVAVSTSAWGLGSHAVTASFDPGSSSDYGASASSTFTVALGANTLDVTGVGVQYATFYPYHDGYRDSEAVRGTRLERAKVLIRIYNSSSRLVRSATVAWGTGAWSFAWNGRTSSGAAVPAGRYAVRQTVTDAHGLSRTYSAFATVSWKRLHTYAKTYTKNATTQLAKNGGTFFGWSFTVPSATVYKKLVFSVYGKTGIPTGSFGPHDYSRCASTTVWSVGCIAPSASFPTSLGWRSVTGSVTRNRHGTNVRMYAVGGYQTAVAYARVTVTYAVLK